jgi:hypothetical protein
VKAFTRLSEWLFRFASSQKNIDCVVKWLSGTAVVLGLVCALAVLIAIIVR